MPKFGDLIHYKELYQEDMGLIVKDEFPNYVVLWMNDSSTGFLTEKSIMDACLSGMFELIPSED